MKTAISSRLFRFLLLLALLLAGCGEDAAAPDESDDLANVATASIDDGILIEGRLLPRTVAHVAFSLPGTVAAVAVADGEQVAAGQLIARLDGGSQAAAAVAGAELELLLAQQDRAALTDPAGRAALENQAYLALLAARQGVWEAQQNLDAITGRSLTREIAAAEAQLVLTAEALQQAVTDLDDYDDDDETVRSALELTAAEAQRAYDAAVQQLDNLQGAGRIFLLQQAENQLAAARRERDLAADRYDEVLAGADADSVALADARVAAAAANLAAARESLAAYELRAPLAGTVVDLALQVGEVVPAGQPVARVADLSAWVIETVDLTEFDVVAVAPGLPLTVSVDALPDVTMAGTVDSVSPAFREVRGEVTYTALITLAAPDPRLRWGMTVLVTAADG